MLGTVCHPRFLRRKFSGTDETPKRKPQSLNPKPLNPEPQPFKQLYKIYSKDSLSLHQPKSDDLASRASGNLPKLRGDLNVDP